MATIDTAPAAALTGLLLMPICPSEIGPLSASPLPRGGENAAADELAVVEGAGRLRRRQVRHA